MTIKGNIGTGKTKLVQRFEQSLSGEVKIKIKVKQEPVKGFQFFMEMV